MSRPDYLFHGTSITDLCRQAQADLEAEIDAWNPDDIMDRPATEIIEHVVDKHSIEVPALDMAGAYVLDEDKQTFHEVGHPYTFYGETARVAFRVITLAIPFTGSPDLFKLRPSASRSSGPPQGRIVGTEVHAVWESPANQTVSPETVNHELERILDSMSCYFGWAKAQADGHNVQIRDVAATRLEQRRKRLTAERELRATLAFPLRRRSDADTYAVPLRRRKLKTLATRERGPAVPYLADDDYEEVLRVLVHQRNQFERSPSLLADMDEEHARDILLIGLNGQFEGRAVGEAFNRTGKTDILVREGDKNVFVGECKFWKGPSTIAPTLDQLLGKYLTWRDTKAAVLLFIRGSKSPTAVIEKALLEFEEHPNFLSRSGNDVPNERYNYLFSAPTDPQQRVRLAFLPFVFA